MMARQFFAAIEAKAIVKSEETGEPLELPKQGHPQHGRSNQEVVFFVAQMKLAIDFTRSDCV